MATPEGDFDIEGILNYVNSMLVSRSPFWRDEPVQDLALVYDRLSESNVKKIVFMEQAVSFFEQMGMTRCKEADAVRDLPRCMECFRSITAQRLREQGVSELDVEMVEGLTIQQVAAHADIRYRETSGSLAAMKMGSREHRQALERAVFWSKVAYRVGLAAVLASEL